MKKLKLSPWHDGSVKPVHVGWYKVIGDSLVNEKGKNFGWRKWDGVSWSWNAYAHDFKSDKYGMLPATIYPDNKWRGVLK